VLLTNARIVLPERIADRGSLIIENDRIERILDSPTETDPKADNLIDLDGLTLFPGFIDIHIHGAAGIDTMAAGANDLRRVAEFLARKGVTGWLPTLVPAPQEQYERVVNAIADSARNQRKTFAPSADADDMSALPAVGARVLGVHFEGPFVNSEQCGALHREHFRTFQRPNDLDELPAIADEEAIHLMTLAPEVDGGIELIKLLKKRNWIVSVGHTQATVEVLDQAFAAGARHMTHFMNAMTPLHHRALGAVGWGMLNDEVSCDVIADGIHIHPPILKLIIRNKTVERISLISDAIAAAGQGDGHYQIWGEQITVKDGRTRNDRGSIAGSVITMLDAARMMLSLGVSESDVARMASLNPARLLGIDDDCGSIEAGKRADLVALDDSHNVRLSIIGGRIAFQESP
jgi:N-acetylglucosamine-6-phosphate deacetylase